MLGSDRTRFRTWLYCFSASGASSLTGGRKPGHGGYCVIISQTSVIGRPHQDGCCIHLPPVLLLPSLFELQLSFFLIEVSALQGSILLLSEMENQYHVSQLQANHTCAPHSENKSVVKS